MSKKGRLDQQSKAMRQFIENAEKFDTLYKRKSSCNL